MGDGHDDQPPAGDDGIALHAEILSVVAATVASLALVWRVGIQLFSQSDKVDPWLYTALMTNFDASYRWFHDTYYAARLPMILPGLFLNSFLTPVTAYVTLHAVFYLVGATFLYLTVRTLFGVRVALVTYPVFLLNVAYLDAHTWDYFDGFAITYLAGALYFMLSSIARASRLRLALSGFFCAAAIATNPFMALLVGGGLVVYLYGRMRTRGVSSIQPLVVDVAAFAAGATVLIAGCGAFARSHGGQLLFFMPSIHTALTLKPGSDKLPDYHWVLAEPRLLIPPFVAVLVLIAWPLRPGSPPNPFGPVLAVTTLATFLLLVYLEVERSRTLLQLLYYFHTLYPLLFVTLAAAVYALLGSHRPGRPSPYTKCAIGLALGATPLLAVYAFEMDALWGRRGALLDVVILGAALAAVAAARLFPGRAAAATPIAVALGLLGVNYASAASAMTHAHFETRDSLVARSDDVFRVGMQLVDFMQANGLQNTLPAFWYNDSVDPELIGVQSLYFFEYTSLNRRMPVLDDDFRSRFALREPERVVLLCGKPGCYHGAEAMRAAGYRPREVARARLSSGETSAWVEAYAMR